MKRAPQFVEIILRVNGPDGLGVGELADKLFVVLQRRSHDRQKLHRCPGEGFHDCYSPRRESGDKVKAPVVAES